MALISDEKIEKVRLKEKIISPIQCLTLASTSRQIPTRNLRENTVASLGPSGSHLPLTGQPPLPYHPYLLDMMVGPGEELQPRPWDKYG